MSVVTLYEIVIGEVQSYSSLIVLALFAEGQRQASHAAHVPARGRVQTLYIARGDVTHVSPRNEDLRTVLGESGSLVMCSDGTFRANDQQGFDPRLSNIPLGAWKKSFSLPPIDLSGGDLGSSTYAAIGLNDSITTVLRAISC